MRAEVRLVWASAIVLVPARYTQSHDAATAYPLSKRDPSHVTFHTSAGEVLTAVPEAVKTELTKIAVKTTKPIVLIILFMIYPILCKAAAYLKLSMCDGSGGRAANIPC